MNRGHGERWEGRIRGETHVVRGVASWSRQAVMAAVVVVPKKGRAYSRVDVHREADKMGFERRSRQQCLLVVALRLISSYQDSQEEVVSCSKKRQRSMLKRQRDGGTESKTEAVLEMMLREAEKDKS